MIQLLIKKFVKDYQNITDPKVRESYGLLTGVLGLICNFFLFTLKLTTGMAINSIAVISDAFNNLSDFGTSLIHIFGVKVSNKPPDKNHPQGHGRFEYIASLSVAFVIFGVGIQLLRSSIDKIIHPGSVEMSVTVLILLLVSVFIKVWMFLYNRAIANRIHSSINKAAAWDSLNDSIATTVVTGGTFVGSRIDFPIDGVLGLLLTILILYTGFRIARDSASLLIGKTPDSDVLEKLHSMVLSGELIVGTHDLVVHDYGPGQMLASIHAEVSPHADIMEVHNQIDQIEKNVRAQLGVDLVIHMDPVEESI